jgi:cis-L-3-hydroxyproline dehydratase
VKVTQVDVYSFHLHYVHGDYVMSDGRRTTTLLTTIVRLTTDTGLTGWGEVCPLGPTYLPSHAGGARAALAELAPAVLNADPTNLHDVHRRMNSALAGHAYAKSPIDIACWDILGKVTGQPVSVLLGGVANERFLLYEAVPLGDPEEMLEQFRSRTEAGIRHFQLKIGDDPHRDVDRIAAILEHTNANHRIVADANGGWNRQEAMVAMNLLRNIDKVFHLEQPCPTLEDCLYVRQHCDLPIVLDEVITDVHSLLRAYYARGMEAFNLKISKFGGLSGAKLVRDLAHDLGLRVTIEDSWGGDLTTAAVSHLAASTDPNTLFTVSFMNDWVTDHIAGYQPHSDGGTGQAPIGPGLGVTVDESQLGKPLLSLSA